MSPPPPIPHLTLTLSTRAGYNSTALIHSKWEISSIWIGISGGGRGEGREQWSVFIRVRLICQVDMDGAKTSPGMHPTGPIRRYCSCGIHLYQKKSPACCVGKSDYWFHLGAVLCPSACMCMSSVHAPLQLSQNVVVIGLNGLEWDLLVERHVGVGSWELGGRSQLCKRLRPPLPPMGGFSPQ